MAYQPAPRLIAFLIEHEGERLTAYRDTKGIWTVGVGHTGPDVHQGLVITRETSRKLLERDLSAAAEAVILGVHVALSGPQRDALIALTFNIGIPAFLGSTVLRRINAGDLAGIPDAFRMWNKETINDRKVVNQGLVNRREAEIELWRGAE